MLDPGTEVIISWDLLTKIENWRGVILDSDEGNIGFERADGELFEVNPVAVRRTVNDTLVGMDTDCIGWISDLSDVSIPDMDNFH